MDGSTVYPLYKYFVVFVLQDIVNKTEDITRETVMKSVCVLTTLVCHVTQGCTQSHTGKGRAKVKVVNYSLGKHARD